MDLKKIIRCTSLLCTLIFLGTVSDSNAHLDKFETDSENFDLTKQTEATVDSLEAFVIDLIRNNQLADAYHWSGKGIELAKKIGYRKGEFNLMLQMGSQFLDRNIPDSTIYYSKRALELAKTDFEKKQALNSLGNGNSRAGRSIIAIDLYEQVVALADSLEDDKYSVGVLINIATTYKNLGEIEESLKYYFEALERSEELGNKEFIALITNNLGDTFIDLENYDQAEYHLNRSKEVSIAEEIKSNLVRVYLNLGNLYKNTARFDAAEESYNKVLEMHRRSGSIRGKIQVTYNLGMMHLAKKDHDIARDYLQKTLADSREMNMMLGLFYSLNGLGELEMTLGNISESVAYYIEAVEIAGNFDSKTMEVEAAKNMYYAFKQAGNESEALNWLEKTDVLKDEIRSAERDRLTAQYEAKFNLRQSEQEKQLIQVIQEQQEAQLNQQRWIILSALAGIFFLLSVGAVLIQTNRKRKNANLKLTDSNRQLIKLHDTIQKQKEELERINNIKTKLFAIIAHDLRGPLGSLQSLLYLLREHDLSEEEKNKLTTTLEKNMNENSSMMDNLLGWAQSQMNGITLNKRSIDLRLCIESVLDQFRLQAQSKNITLAIYVSEDTYIFADYDLMKLVLRNLIANAIKFSYSDSTIQIGAEQTEEAVWQISVKDFGLGISQENQAKIFTEENFTSPGTNLEKGNGLGLNLCKEYVEKHGGTIWLKSQAGEGTTFYFTVAADQKKEKLVSA